MKLLNPVMVALLKYFNENKEVKLSEFCHVTRHSYQQALSYKEEFIKKELMQVERKGRYDYLTLTEKGRKVMEAALKLSEVLYG